MLSSPSVAADGHRWICCAVLGVEGKSRRYSEKLRQRAASVFTVSLSFLRPAAMRLARTRIKSRHVVGTWRGPDFREALFCGTNYTPHETLLVKKKIFSRRSESLVLAEKRASEGRIEVIAAAEINLPLTNPIGRRASSRRLGSTPRLSGQLFGAEEKHAAWQPRRPAEVAISFGLLGTEFRGLLDQLSNSGSGSGRTSWSPAIHT
jgi:hypothetical protein